MHVRLAADRDQRMGPASVVVMGSSLLPLLPMSACTDGRTHPDDESEAAEHTYRWTISLTRSLFSQTYAHLEER